MAKRKKSYAETVSQAQLMAGALKANVTEVKKRGIDETFVERLENTCGAAIDVNKEQEKLKADLKTKTTQLEGLLDEMGNMLSEARKVVKLAIPQSQWKEFGVGDRR